MLLCFSFIACEIFKIGITSNGIVEYYLGHTVTNPDIVTVNKLADIFELELVDE